MVDEEQGGRSRDIQIEKCLRTTSTAGGQTHENGIHQRTEFGGRSLNLQWKSLVGNAKNGLRRPGQFHQSVGLVDPSRQRIFRKHMFAGLDGTDSYWAVAVVVGAYSHRIQVRLADQRFPIREEIGSKLLRQLWSGVRVARGDRTYSNAIKSVKRGGMAFGHSTRSDDSQLNVGHAVLRNRA